jgi:hypothetical protein
VIWNNTQGQIFSVNALTGLNKSHIASDGPVTLGFSVAKVPFRSTNIRLDNPSGGSTSDARVALQGNLDFADLGSGKLGLPGLKVGVTGVNWAYIDENGTTLTGVNATVNGNFSAAGVTFVGTFGATYTPTGNVFGLQLHAVLLDGVITFDATIQVNGSFQIWVRASASANVPKSIPLVGGQHLGSMDFCLAFDPNDTSHSYATVQRGHIRLHGR